MIDYKYFYGLDEVSCDVNSGCDKSLKNEYIAHFAKAFNCKSARVWLLTKEVIRIRKDDEIEFIPEGLTKFHNYIEKLRRAGIERFLLLDWGFVYPYGYKATDNWVVPDPKTEPETYKRFMLLQQKVRYEIANNFSFIQYFETTNEPEGDLGPFLHKNGYNKNRIENEKVFTREEIEDIVLDLNYFETLGIKEAYRNNKMLLPSFMNFDYAPGYLDRLYTKIKSGKYPTIGPAKSNKIESFFEILSFHPYNLKSSNINEDWYESQRKLRDVMIKHNDQDRKVWFTEIGWSDMKRDPEKYNVAKRYIDLFEAVKTMPWVETVFLFRLFNLANAPENEGEDNFGLIYNAYDWKSPLAPKPAAIEIYKYIHGENAPLDELYKFASKGKERVLFPHKIINPCEKAYRILILGNHITYQSEAPWNNVNEAKGLDASSSKKDFAHLLFNELKTKRENVEMTLVDAREWETGFFADYINEELAKFNNNPDLVIVRFGEDIVDCVLNDYNYQDYLKKLCSIFKNEHNQIIITSTFKGKRVVDEYHKKVAEELGYEFVDLSELSLNYSCLSKGNFPNKENTYYPNDDGMKIIADLIFNKIKL